MTWLVFTYSLPAAERSSPRVAVWRRLNRLGAISPRAGVHILPARDECLEAFQWLGKEVQQHRGESLLMRVQSFESMTNAEVVELFQQKSDKDYHELDAAIAGLEKLSRKRLSVDERVACYAELKKLRKTQQEILKTDFFNSPAGARIVSRFARLERLLSEDSGGAAEIIKVSKDDFQNKVWVTRPRPHVDRLSSAWLIRRFIDPNATIIYSRSPERGQVGFDLKAGGTFGHVGRLCTFETMIVAFDLQDVALRKMGEIIHEIDLRDGLYTHPEIVGLDLVLKGWLLSGMTDRELEAHGIRLFEGLFQALDKETSSVKASKRA